MFCSNNYKWEQSNYLYTIVNDNQKYDQKKNLSIKKNNFKLIRKIEFGFGNELFAIIKYHINENGTLKPFCSLFKYVNNKWQIDMPDLSISKLYLIFTYMSADALDAIFLGMKTNILPFDNKITELNRNGIFDIVEYMNYKPENKMTKKDTKILLKTCIITGKHIMKKQVTVSIHTTPRQKMFGRKGQMILIIPKIRMEKCLYVIIFC